MQDNGQASCRRRRYFLCSHGSHCGHRQGGWYHFDGSADAEERKGEGPLMGCCKEGAAWKRQQVLESLLSYKDYVDAFAVPEINWREIRPYLELNHFNPETIEGKSKAAAGLCSWVVSIVTYHDTIVGVEPKRKALKQANERLDAATQKMNEVNARVAELTEKLAKLRAELQAANEDKQAAIDDVNRGQNKLDLAQRLTSALASEMSVGRKRCPTQGKIASTSWATRSSRAHSCLTLARSQSPTATRC